MRKIILLIFGLFCAAGMDAAAQDVITRRNGEDIKALIVEVTDDAIKYKRENLPDGPLFTISKADVLVIAVKPAVVPEVLQQIAQELTSPKLVLSVALGSTTQMLEAALPGFPVVRVMPNTPIALGKGMSLLARGRYVTDEQMQTARDLFGCAGRVEELPENLFDAATAVSGSGPAFIYYVIAALAKGGMDLGLPEKTANLLAAQMTSGAASMALLSGQSPAALQKSVTTPGGCTAAGVAVLEETRADQIFEKVVQATVAKAQEFAK